MKAEHARFLDDHFAARKLAPVPTLRCTCCGTSYQRGEFKCCAPPKNMASHYWLALSCPMPANGGCGKCFKHCECPSKSTRVQPGPLRPLILAWLEEMERTNPAFKGFRADE